MFRRIYHQSYGGMQHMLLLLLLCSPVYADESIKLSTGADSTYIHLDISENILNFEAGIASLKLKFIDGDQVKLLVPALEMMAPVGEPALPGWTVLVESGPLPGVLPEYEILDSFVFDLGERAGGRRLLAVQQRDSKGSLRDGEGLDYDSERWYGGTPVKVEFQGVMRELPVSTLRFRPFRYHPGKQLLVVYSRVRCSIELSGGSPGGADQASFKGLLQKVHRQENRLQNKALETEQPLGLIVLSDTLFRRSLQPLLSWKRKRGFNVTALYRQDLEDPSVSGMKKELEGLYDQPSSGLAPPSYLLIVGDVQHIPHSGTGANVTDLYYTTFDGEGDFLPELFCGRISVKDSAQLRAVVEKIIEYEGYAFPDASFLNRSVLIAGVDGFYAELHGNGQLNYLHEHYLTGKGDREDHVFYYPGSDTASPDIIELLSGGVGFVNYTGHGEWDRWRDPLFSRGQVDGLQNTGAYPLMIGNGCETNIFTRDECFAEALLRAPGKGALAYIGCTSDSFWDEDYYWSVGVGEIVRHPEYESTSLACFDRSFHTHGEDYSQWAVSTGEMMYWGNMAVQESGSSLSRLYWEIYQLAGDPTLQPWFSIPGSGHPVYPAQVPPGSRSLHLHCDPYAYVALSHGDTLLAARHASGSGLAILDLPLLSGNAELDLVITGQDLQPYEGRVEVSSMEGAYLELETYAFRDGDGASVLHPGVTVHMDLVLVNRGGGPGLSDTLILRSGDTGIELLDSLVLFHLPAPGDSLHLREAFRFRVAEDKKDMESCWLSLHPGGEQTPMYLEFTVEAPRLLSGGIRWEETGQRDGRSTAGEWINCSWTLFNTGHYHEDSLVVNFGGLNMELFDSVVVEEPLTLIPGDSTALSFALRLAPAATDYMYSGQLSVGRGAAVVRDSFALWPGGYLLDCSGEPGRNFPFKNDSHSPWKPEASSFLSAPSSYRSGPIAHMERSRLDMVFFMEKKGQVRFSYRVSSEVDYDFLVFEADGMVLGSWSGERDWTPYALELDSGLHQLSWSYEKDKNTNGGLDAAWIDDLYFPEGTFSRGDLVAERIVNVRRAPGIPEGEKVGLQLRNNSRLPMEHVELEYFINGKRRGSESLGLSLDPGTSVRVFSENTFHLMNESPALLEIRILSDSLSYQGNSRAELLVERYTYPDMAVDSLGIRNDGPDEPQLIVFLENRGNVAGEAGSWKYLLDGQVQEQGTEEEVLLPGELQELQLALFAAGENREANIYMLGFSLLDSDSLLANNELEKAINWTSLKGVETALAGQWSLHPNPVGDLIVISREGDSARELILELIDARGRCCEVFILPAATQQAEYSMDSYAAGLYVLRSLRNGSSYVLVIR